MEQEELPLEVLWSLTLVGVWQLCLSTSENFETGCWANQKNLLDAWTEKNTHRTTT
jgi:hypothetical protein